MGVINITGTNAPRRKDFGRGTIVELRNKGLSQRAITDRINGSQIDVCVCDPKRYGPKTGDSRLQMMLNRDERLVIRTCQQCRTVQIHKEISRRTFPKSEFRHWKRFQRPSLKMFHKQ